MSRSWRDRRRYEPEPRDSQPTVDCVGCGREFSPSDEEFPAVMRGEAYICEECLIAQPKRVAR